MGQKRQFPITLKAGSTAIKIYRNPHRVHLQNGEREYNSFVVSYYRGKKRCRARFNTIEDAETEAQRIQTAILNEDLTALELTGHDRVSYARALHAVQKFGVSLDIAAAEYAAAREKLGSVGLLEAVEFYDRFGRTIKEVKSVPLIVDELIRSLQTDGASDYHCRDMKNRLGAFAEAFPDTITTVSSKNVAEWLQGLRKEDRKGNKYPIAPKTRNHYRNAIVQLFNFARDHGYLPKGLPTEVESLKALKVTPKENAIFTVHEMAALLQNAREHLIPALAIKAFSGVRTEEMVKLHWEHIDWDSRHIKLPAGITKTTQRRLIPIPDNLFNWLQPFRACKGRICERWKRPQALVQAFDRYASRQGIEVGANKFRNSYISYRVALTKDVQRVSLESGNSPRIIQREYLELANEADAQKWFQIVPGMKEVEAPAEGHPTNPKKVMGHVRVPKRKLVHHPALPISVGKNERSE